MEHYDMQSSLPLIILALVFASIGGYAFTREPQKLSDSWRPRRNGILWGALGLAFSLAFFITLIIVDGLGFINGFAVIMLAFMAPMAFWLWIAMQSDNASGHSPIFVDHIFFSQVGKGFKAIFYPPKPADHKVLHSDTRASSQG